MIAIKLQDLQYQYFWELFVSSFHHVSNGILFSGVCISEIYCYLTFSCFSLFCFIKPNIIVLFIFQVTRIPVDSTLRYTKWINSLDNSQLYTQIYTSNGPTIVMPTWFCHRSVFNIVGGFDEGGKGVPEDYLFFLKFLHLKGRLHRVDKPLLMYRHHPNATTFSVSEFTIWDIRIRELERNVLSNWTSFTIWNAGKQGRKFYRDLTDENRKKVACFCDVDEKKIAKKVYIYELEKSTVKTRVPILHFSKANKPFVICVKLDLTGGAFEANLASLNLCEGEDYVVFS